MKTRLLCFNMCFCGLAILESRLVFFLFFLSTTLKGYQLKSIFEFMRLQDFLLNVRALLNIKSSSLCKECITTFIVRSF